MRRLWDGLGLMLATAFGLSGCASADIAPKPPKHPEEITVPPAEDSKFSLPPQYPKDTLNKDEPLRPSTMPGGPGGPGGPAGMGGMGGPGAPGGGYGGRRY